ncbi:MAG TPA: cell division ATP-binding protein FtsE [Candidatus Eisenbacteria bacterium]|nr:cell division ATP-binding protein FtsE [Candidatus Eisenbacteria bacterium]
MIELFHVSKIYPPNAPALSDISLQIQRGEFVFLSGPSGAGKTTLLKLLFREEAPTQGQIIINGENILRLKRRGVARLRRRIGLVFQECKLLPRLTALENVALAAEVVGLSKRASEIKAYHLLRELGLREKYAARPVTLSGGEQQRVAIARALMNDPMLVLADEPTGNLDREMAEEIMKLFVKVRERGTTLIVASHDTELLGRYGTRAIALRRGRLEHDSRAPRRQEFVF